MTNEKKKENLITEGVIWRQLLLFFFPIVIGTLFQQLYNTADAVIVGRFVGKAALASVGGSAAVLTYQVVMFFTGLSSGASVIISQYFGAGDHKNLHKALHTAYAFSIIASILIGIAGYSVTPWLLRIMNTPAEIMADSVLYLRIYFSGIIFTLVYNMGAAIMRAVGDSKRPLYYLIVCCITNIGLDLLFVIVFQMGIAGAAIATIIAQAVSAVLVTRALIKSYDTLKLNLKHLRPDLQVLKSELRIGMPGGIQSLMYGLTNVIIQSAINSFGTDTAAAWAAFGKLDILFWAVSGAFGITAATFSGQNYGAGKPDRVYKSVRVSLGMSLCVCGTILATLMLFSRPLMCLFTTDAAVIDIGVYMMIYVLPSYIIYVFVEILNAALRGMGDVLIPTLITLGGVCGVRLPWILFVVPMHRELSAILISYPIAWAATTILLIPYYFYKKRLQKRQDFFQKIVDILQPL